MSTLTTELPSFGCNPFACAHDVVDERDDSGENAWVTSFRKLVRTNKLKGPFQHGFSREHWETAGAAIARDAAADQALFDAGLWFAERSEMLRTRIAGMSTPAGVSQEQAVRRSIGVVNRNAAIALAHTESALVAKTVDGIAFAHHAIEHTIRLEGGGSVSPAGIIESSVDGLRFELARIDALEEVGKGTLPELDAYFVASNASIAYHMYEQLWNRCVWDDHHLERRAEDDLIVPDDLSRAAADAVSEYRRESLLLQGAHRAIQVLEALPTELRERERARLRIVGVERSKRGLEVRLGRGGELPGTELIARLQVEEPYLKSLFDRPLPNWAPLTLQHLLDAWLVLAPLADVLRDRLPQITVTNGRELESYAPRVSRRTLVSALVEGLGVDVPRARDLLSRFIWEPSPRNSLWQAPFVASGKDDLLPVLPALGSPNPFRSIEQWMALGGLDLDVRGPAFEEAFRIEAQAWFEDRSRAFKRGAAVPESIVISETVGDLDCVLWIGDVVLVCELKCLRYPAGAIEDARYRARLEEAAAQLRVRRAAIEASPELLAAELRRFGYEGDATRVEYAIVVNTALGTLQEFDGFPVVDELILGSYVRDGEVPMFVVMGRKGPDQIGETRVFYADEDEAAANLGAYLRAPPHLAFHRSFTKLKLNPIPGFAGQRPAALVEFAVELPSGTS